MKAWLFECKSKVAQCISLFYDKHTKHWRFNAISFENIHNGIITHTNTQSIEIDFEEWTLHSSIVAYSNDFIGWASFKCKFIWSASAMLCQWSSKYGQTWLQFYQLALVSFQMSCCEILQSILFDLKFSADARFVLSRGRAAWTISEWNTNIEAYEPWNENNNLQTSDNAQNTLSNFSGNSRERTAARVSVMDGTLIIRKYKNRIPHMTTDANEHTIVSLSLRSLDMKILNAFRLIFHFNSSSFEHFFFVF